MVNRDDGVNNMDICRPNPWEINDNKQVAQISGYLWCLPFLFLISGCGAVFL